LKINIWDLDQETKLNKHPASKSKIQKGTVSEIRDLSPWTPLIESNFADINDEEGEILSIIRQNRESLRRKLSAAEKIRAETEREQPYMLVARVKFKLEAIF